MSPVLSFTRADCELLARYGNARVRWSRVDAASKSKLANVRERVKEVIAVVAERQTTGIALTQFVSVLHASDRVPTDYWACLYPAEVPSKAFALQMAMIISGTGAELCFTLGSSRREMRDFEAAMQNRHFLEVVQEGLAALPLDGIHLVEELLEETWRVGKGTWRFRKSMRRSARVSDFETLAEWAHYAASPLGAGACISINLSPSALEKLGVGIVDRVLEMTTIFAPLLQYIYGSELLQDVRRDERSAIPTAHTEYGKASGYDKASTVWPRAVAEEAPTYGTVTALGTPIPSLAPSSESVRTAARIHTPVRPFTLDMAAADLFIPRDELQHMLALLSRRRNLILEGAPGVGKTFVARRLAYTLLGATDPTRMEMVQFHPSYSYEDFVQGWRPAANGSFVLRNGVFHDFCTIARTDLERPYVFVIDEINRGNVSGIFGELLMLLERDKRGDEHAVSLTYTLGLGDRFAIPPNVHLIATMNTADRSLAMVDYALRRRFAFVRLQPAFEMPSFVNYLTKHGVSKALARRIATRMTTLNADIAADRKRLGPGFEIGHSAFVPAGDGPHNDAWYHDLIHTEIEPLLREYWFDDPDRAAEAVARLLA